MKTKKHFFTLVEILTVAVIIAVLAGISIGVVGLIANKNAEAKTLSTIKALELALGQYKADNGNIYPTSLNAPIRFNIPSQIPDNLNGTLLKYLDQKLLNSASKVDGNDRYFVDGWGRPLIYRMPGSNNKTGYDLGSVGPDGKIGDGGTVITDSVPSSISDYDNFGKGDDITNFLKKD